MKTKGIEIVEGGLIVPVGRGVPDAFWGRLRLAVDRVCLGDEFQADRLASAKGEGFPWDREERLFRRWVERLGLASERWPWERGWTEELVDSYLIAPVKALEAA
jgi:hypothetical protein